MLPHLPRFFREQTPTESVAGVNQAPQGPMKPQTVKHGVEERAHFNFKKRHGRPRLEPSRPLTLTLFGYSGCRWP